MLYVKAYAIDWDRIRKHLWIDNPKDRRVDEAYRIILDHLDKKIGLENVVSAQRAPEKGEECGKRFSVIVVQEEAYSESKEELEKLQLPFPSYLEDLRVIEISKSSCLPIIAVKSIGTMRHLIIANGPHRLNGYLILIQAKFFVIQSKLHQTAIIMLYVKGFAIDWDKIQKYLDAEPDDGRIDEAYRIILRRLSETIGLGNVVSAQRTPKRGEEWGERLTILVPEDEAYNESKKELEKLQLSLPNLGTSITPFIAEEPEIFEFVCT
ncbi:hypothetical protein DL96DRAFT_1561058 [Flagelloscypha sp. PMI_526]|nr:hypothetical protein DL96DRAFT_1561058 [Flagelloscypha sp. PMI_526]